MSERSDKERVMADEKKITFEMATRERIGLNLAAVINCTTRIEACREILKRDPGSKHALEPTISIWIRIRDYHLRTIESCRQALKDLGLPEAPPEIDPRILGA